MTEIYHFRTRPGAQPANQVAGTLKEQFARVFQPRPTASIDEAIEARVRVIVRVEIAALVKQLPKLVKVIVQRKRGRRAP